MPPTPQELLGQLIFKANPYTQYQNAPAMQPTLNETEADSYSGLWNFKDSPQRVALALRIPYTYTDEHGITLRDYLLIGFEGSGGD